MDGILPPLRHILAVLAGSTAAGAIGFAISESVDFEMIRGPFPAVTVVLLARDSFTRRLRWLAVRPILTNPVSVEDLALTPNPNAWLVEWLRRRDASRAVELARSVVLPALLIASFGGFADGPGSTAFRAKLSLLCAGSLLATRIALWRTVQELWEADLVAAPPPLVWMALKRVSAAPAEKPGLHPAAHSPALLILAGTLAGVLLYLDTASDVTAVVALVLLPLAFPLYVLFSRPRRLEVTPAAERATSWLVSLLAQATGPGAGSKPRRLGSDPS